MAQGTDNTTRAKSISQLKSTEDLTKHFESLRRGRQLLESQWKLNLAFYKGRQYSYVNRHAPGGAQVQSLPTEDGEKPRYRVRLVSNQVITGTHSLLAKYTKTKPQITASPASGSQSDLKAAQMAEALFENWWDDLSLDSKREEAILWALVTGQGYWKIDWDPYAAKPMTFLLRPDGTVITDEQEKAAFHETLKKYGIEGQEKTIYQGDVRVSVPSPFQVYLDPTASVWEEAKYAICEEFLDPDEVWARWRVRVEPDAVSQQPDVALPFTAVDSGTEQNVKKVNFGYFPPGPALPKGRYVVWINGRSEPLEDKPWPYPTNKLPFIKFPGLRSPGQVYDGSHVEQAIPLQKELNRTLSQIVEYKNLTIRPRVWAPTNSVRTRLTSEPGALYEYNPVGNFKPEIETMPALPPYVFEHLKEIAARLKDIFNLTEISEGTLPPNLESGIAIDLLQELSADRIAPAIKLMEKGLAKAGQQLLALAQKYYAEERMLQIKGPGGSVQVKKFKQADIQGGVSIDVETGSGLPRTRAGRQAQVERWMEQGIIPPDKAYKYIDMADLKGLSTQFAQAEDQAHREIEKIVQGVPINPEAVQEAMVQVNQGINPETGDPIQSPEEAQHILLTAGMQPLLTENYDVHLDVLGTWMNSVEFESLAPDVRQRAIMHFQATLAAKQGLPVAAEGGKVNTNLQIKATLGPTAASKILERQGVSVTPEEMAEPPLETWVSDSVDKPDADAAGPGQEGNNLSQAAQVMLETKAKIAEGMQGAVQKEQDSALGQAKTEQEMRHAEERHQAEIGVQAVKLQREQEAHEAKVKAMSQPKPPTK